MHEFDDVELRNLVKQALPRAHTELQRDLWPAMLRRMEESELRAPWFDWVLLGAITACVLLAPQMIPMLLYHL